MSEEQLSPEGLRKLSFEARIGYEIEDTELFLENARKALEDKNDDFEKKVQTHHALKRGEKKFIEAAESTRRYHREMEPFTHDEGFPPEKDAEWLKNFVPAKLIEEIEITRGNIEKDRERIKSIATEIETLESLYKNAIRVRRAVHAGKSIHSFNN